MSCGALPVAATIMASSRLGLSTCLNSTGAPSITMCTPLSLSCAMRSSLTVEVMMVLPASSSRPNSSSSCAAATITVAFCMALRSTKRVHSLDRPGGQAHRQRPVLHIVRAGAVQLQRLQRGQELGHAELQQRIGKVHVLGVLRHRHRQLVVGHARQEQHPRVVEVVAELDLRVAHRPFLQDVAEPPADGGRHLCHHRLQLGAVLFNETVRAGLVAVLEHAQADGVGLLVPLLDQRGGLGRAAIRAQAAHVHLFTEESGREFKVLGGRAQADADN